MREGLGFSGISNPWLRDRAGELGGTLALALTIPKDCQCFAKGGNFEHAIEAILISVQQRWPSSSLSSRSRAFLVLAAGTSPASKGRSQQRARPLAIAPDGYVPGSAHAFAHRGAPAIRLPLPLLDESMLGCVLRGFTEEWWRLPVP